MEDEQKPSPWISETEAARMLGVDPRTLATRARDHGLTQVDPLSMGRHRYLRAEVVAYIERLKAESQAKVGDA